MSRKRNPKMKPRPTELPCPVRSTIANNQPMPPGQAQAYVDGTRAALRGLLASTASDKEFSRVAMDVNIAFVLADSIKGSELTEDLFARAGHALNAADRMHTEHGRYGLGDQADRHAICEAIDLWEELLRASSPRQMQDAEAAVLAKNRALNRRQKAHA